MADDEPLPDLDLTVSRIFAEIGGQRVVPAQLVNDAFEVTEVAAVRVETTRGDGEATWTDAVPTESVFHHFGIGNSYLTINVICESGLDVPARIDAAREDRTGAFQGEHRAWATPELLLAAEIGASASGTGSGDWASYTSASTYYEGGVLTSLQLRGPDGPAVDLQ